jgi:hypothetical protein
MMRRVFLERLGHLDRELPRRRKHQHLRQPRLHVELCQHRQRKGCGLARTGLGLAEHVNTRQHGWE